MAIATRFLAAAGARARVAVRLTGGLLIALCIATEATAGYEEGAAALQRGDYEIAFRELLPLAEAGDPYSEWLVAVMYRDRLGMKLPPDKAASLEIKAAAVKFMRRAAEHGVPYAMFDLGQMYSSQRWGPPDTKETLKWFTRAAEQGTPEFELILGMMHYQGDDQYGIPQSNSDALRWVRLSAGQDFAPAQYMMGVMLEEGRAVPGNLAEAIDWYQRAADQGIAGAQGSLGDLYYHGVAVEQDCTIAMKRLQAAADQDLGYAQYMLGQIFERGDCASKNLVQAYVWYSNAWFHGCGYVRENALDRRNRLESQMTKSQYSDADETWRHWKPTFTPNLERFQMYHWPHVELPRSYCGWSALD